MTITLPLQPQEEAKLIAVAQAKGVSTEALVREALDKILAESPDPQAEPIITYTAILREICEGGFRDRARPNRDDR